MDATTCAEPPEPHAGSRRGPAPSPTADDPSAWSETDDDGLIRLQKLLAQSGVASRRKCEELMLAGLVEVDGEVVTRLGTKVDPTHRGDPGRRASGCRRSSPHVYLVAEQAPRRRLDDVRPRGSAHPAGPRRRPARAALPRRPARHRHLRADPADQRRRLRAADGAPVVRGGQDLRRRGRGRVHQATLKRLLGRRHPRRRPGRPCPGRGWSARPGRSQGRSIVELVIHEGRNRIVRRLLDHVGHPVRRLTRTAIGPVRLQNLAPGTVRELTVDELGALLDSARL